MLPSGSNANATAAKQQHLQFLDGLRAVAALVVVLHHAWLQSWPSTLYPALKPHGITAALTGWLTYGKLAVTAFIAISGFCLMLPVVRSNNPLDFGKFFARRCRRILPPYYAALGLALLEDVFILKQKTMTVYDASFPLSAGGILSHFLLIQNFTANPYQITGPFWSIAVEFQIYLLFPLFVAIYRKWGILQTLVATSLVGYAGSFMLGHAGWKETYCHYFAVFGFGMAAAHFAVRFQREASTMAKNLCLLAIPALLIFGVAVHHRFGSDKLVTDTLMGLLVSSVLLLATIAPGGLLSRSLSIAPLAWIGTFSYSIYLIHFPVQQLIWQYTAEPGNWSRLVTFVFVSTVGTAAILGVGYFFFTIFEKPYMSTRAVSALRVAASASNQNLDGSHEVPAADWTSIEADLAPVPISEASPVATGLSLKAG